MIEIKVDKESEIIWLKSLLGAGSLNATEGYKFKFLGVPLNQTVTFKPSDHYEDDIKEKREEFNRRFAGLTGMQINDILRKELEE